MDTFSPGYLYPDLSRYFYPHADINPDQYPRTTDRHTDPDPDEHTSTADRDTTCSHCWTDVPDMGT
jgi:hypothetical protein